MDMNVNKFVFVYNVVNVSTVVSGLLTEILICWSWRVSSQYERL
jgi:hypothetical protein